MNGSELGAQKALFLSYEGLISSPTSLPVLRLMFAEPLFQHGGYVCYYLHARAE